MITKYICLDSYSSSIGWLGYVTIKTDDIEYRISTSKAIINKLLKNVMVFSTLIAPDNDEDAKIYWELNERQLSCIKTLIEAGIVKSTGELSLKEISSECIDCLNLMIFTSYALDGHVFYTSEDQRIFIYPHDDFGVGFILKYPDEKELFIDKINNIISLYKNTCYFVSS